MNFKTALFLTLPLALFGCPDDEPTVVPVPTADTAEPTTVPPTPDPPTFDIVLADGDGESDVTGGADDDTLTLTITNTPAGDWEFGYAQTQSGSAGWYGEDCNTGDYCHPIPLPDTAGVSTLVLTRVETQGAIVEGSTMLLPVDMPVTGTPDLTYYVGTVAEDEDSCVVWGDEPDYYMALNCDDPGARGTSNEVAP